MKFHQMMGNSVTGQFLVTCHPALSAQNNPPYTASIVYSVGIDQYICYSG